MDPIHSSSYDWISAVCSAASVQEELAKHSGQCNSRIAGSWITLDTLETTRKMDSIIYFVMCVVCKLLSWLGIFQKCQQKSINICPVPATKVQGCHFRQQELCDEEQLPDRMENPCEYEQLTQNRDNNNEDEDGLETDNLPTLGAYTNDYGSFH